MKSLIAIQTEQVLEWPLFLEFLAHEAASTMGAELCLSPTCAINLDDARLSQQETAEMVDILSGDHPLPPLAFPDIRPTLARAEKKGLLDGEALRDISLILGLTHTIKSLLQKHEQTFPVIASQGQRLRDLEWVKRAIDGCIDRDGQLLESASFQLQQMKQKSHGLRQTMRRRLEHLLTSQEYEGLLQGQYFAERENRYVIPVKAERRHDIDGIVHDISGSGATVLVEPRQLIDLNNSIKFADILVEQESRRLLQDLSDLVSDHTTSLEDNLSCLAMLDCLMAKARLSIKLNASPIRLTEKSRIDLQQARHPILALTKQVVVANSFRMEGDTKALIISGPNAGGKTVSLKLIGLVAMMGKTGLHPPCAPGSEIAFFEHIYADIGDTQDLSKDISSFTGHILNIIALLKEVGTSQTSRIHDSLILLDEVGSSTDPIEGAALAEAILTYLCQLRCMIVATTHYPRLKILALANPQFHNASQELDLETLSPTYRLVDGIPGGSSALEIAERLGLPPPIIQSALSVVQQQDSDLTSMLRSLHDTQIQLEKEMSQVLRLRQESDRLYHEAQAIREKFQVQEQQDRQRYQKQWQLEFSKAQRLLNQMIEQVKRKPSSTTARTIQQHLHTIHDDMQAQLPNPPAPASRTLRKGDVVEIQPFGSRGILLEDPADRKLVTVRVGSQTVKTAPSALLFVSNLPQPDTHTVQQKGGRATFYPTGSSGHYNIPPFPDTTSYEQKIDIRGLRLEEAMETTAGAIDRALAGQTKYLKIIHGHGSGILKSGVRTFCESSPYIERFRMGDPAEGGEGVTIIELR